MITRPSGLCRLKSKQVSLSIVLYIDSNHLANQAHAFDKVKVFDSSAFVKVAVSPSRPFTRSLCLWSAVCANLIAIMLFKFLAIYLPILISVFTNTVSCEVDGQHRRNTGYDLHRTIHEGTDIFVPCIVMVLAVAKIRD